MSGGALSREAAGGAIPAVVLGGTGYVAGELLRLIAGHPHLKLAAVMSEGSPGWPGRAPRRCSPPPRTASPPASSTRC